MTDFETEFSFTLPRGFLDKAGNLHREGVMRLANAGDEILPLRDPRVQQNPGYLTIILLARVITKLGTLPTVDTNVIERLYTMDLAYLQDLYERVNTMEMPMYKTICPHCGEEIEVPVNFMDAGL
ncbi:phage tail assembly protein [Bacilliculturomica massiliensis]|uniref:phage tail assembly protein n=1 Tax=Bacilliculturomica massiliensis TaxID=1917867 RepID=UPI001031C4C4|nr:phage tail assembly protein [Bacilliculturomica massiliensis]